MFGGGGAWVVCHGMPCRFMQWRGTLFRSEREASKGGACRPSSPLPSAYKRSKKGVQGGGIARLAALRNSFLDGLVVPHRGQRRERERKAQREGGWRKAPGGGRQEKDPAEISESARVYIKRLNKSRRGNAHLVGKASRPVAKKWTTQ